MSYFHSPTPAFIGLLAWRGVVGCIALYSALFKPLDTAVVALGGLAVLLIVGELTYSMVRHREAELARKARDKALQEQRAAEARLRYEAHKEQDCSADDDYMNLDVDLSVRPLELAPPSDPAVPSAVGRMSGEEFEAALLELDVEATVTRLKKG